MNKNIATILLTIVILFGTATASEQQLKSTALEAIDLLFLKGDTEAFLKLVAPDAERKMEGEGSAIEGFKKQKKGTFSKAKLSKVIFVTTKDIPHLKETYPDDMWDEGRVPVHLGDGIGCLILVDVGKEMKGMLFFTVEEVESKCIITYFDDN